MNIILNGENTEVGETASIQALIERLELTGRRIAVEVNEEIVPRSEHESHQLAPGDQVEIVHAIGGG
ncbi:MULTISPECIES: sulfur carrier protein ThiS [Gammaproteobacteria]|jgi:sulfur carrier protein|uniref:Sulfur carrier protein ThiS n=1 Tax=Vreelandella halophila TaxID=86177 RepID=A0A9X4YCM4_9GAMM|nr:MULTISPECIES: sulfur carrier protein ThiS [Gammaproteobacteria]KAA8983560.1 sulfur carrier protein ThiS [Halospina sp. K52047b]MYL27259.1 sulfur carrier protein ThiS [Halomonas utahensis]MYL74461.1 sulfur carrier protein ThiS [Halomonas sp. 22501_18_FS]